jgi:hypothetical protein
VLFCFAGKYMLADMCFFLKEVLLELMLSDICFKKELIELMLEII